MCPTIWVVPDRWNVGTLLAVCIVYRLLLSWEEWYSVLGYPMEFLLSMSSVRWLVGNVRIYISSDMLLQCLIRTKQPKYEKMSAKNTFWMVSVERDFRCNLFYVLYNHIQNTSYGGNEGTTHQYVTGSVISRSLLSEAFFRLTLWYYARISNI